MSIDALILAAGKGTRMPSPRPKVLQTLLGETMLTLVTATLNAMPRIRGIFTMVGCEAAMVSAEAELAAARASVKQAEAEVNSARADAAGAEANIQAMKADIARIQADLDDCKLISPINGRVQYRIAETGEVLSSGGRVLNLVDLTDVAVVLKVEGLILCKTEVGKHRQMAGTLNVKYIKEVNVCTCLAGLAKRFINAVIPVRHRNCVEKALHFRRVHKTEHTVFLIVFWSNRLEDTTYLRAAGMNYRASAGSM